jgi:hypothetical protein
MRKVPSVSVIARLLPSRLRYPQAFHLFDPDQLHPRTVRQYLRRIEIGIPIPLPHVAGRMWLAVEWTRKRIVSRSISAEGRVGAAHRCPPCTLSLRSLQSTVLLPSNSVSLLLGPQILLAGADEVIE